MDTTATITEFVNECFNTDHSVFAFILRHFEEYKAARPHRTIDEVFYREFAEWFSPNNRMKTICLLRQYEEYKAHKVVLMN